MAIAERALSALKGRIAPEEKAHLMLRGADFSHIGALLCESFKHFESFEALIEMHRAKQNKRLRYGEVATETAKVAQWLDAEGISPGDRVAVLMSNQARWLIAAAAIFHRGGVLIPIDYKLRPEEQQRLLSHAQPRVLITEGPAATALRAAAMLPNNVLPNTLVSEPLVSGTQSSRLGSNETDWDTLEHVPALSAPVHRDPDDLATIVYSSGTGGDPKGCMLSHHNYLAQLDSLSALHPMGPGDRYFSILPTNHAIDFMSGFIGPFAGGATVVHQRALRPEFIKDTMKSQRITHMALVPLILQAFERSIKEQLSLASPSKQQLFRAALVLNRALTSRRPQRTISKALFRPIHDAFGGHLRVLFCGGAFVDPDRARFFYELGIPVIVGYGLTEACTVLTLNPLSPYRADSVGKPLHGVSLELRDQSDGVGEVWVKSPTVMKGYFKDEEQTQEVLQQGWLRTGDLGFIDDQGHLHLVGRRKNMIVTAGGKNVYPEDIEQAFENLPCEEYAVFASPYLFDTRQLGRDMLVLVVRGKKAGFDAELRTQNRKLTDFKRIGGVLEVEEPFPRTASMKLRRAALRNHIAQQIEANEVEALS